MTASVHWLPGSEDPQFWLPMWAICLTLVLGLVLRRLWVLHVLQGIAIFSSVAWTATVVAIAWKGWPYSDLLSSIVSLIPGLAAIAFSWGMFLLVRQSFRRLSQAGVPQSNA
ncbi:hypothetical protein [Inquilinus limosus]|uniref:hypothetical protein n=1 Tax=Inquilinus limosus TaxID=171674 RepID=UPI0012DD495D|nr:hypothetical protein [Inquilinus limosus]